jgi:chromosome segregation ATPase
MMRERWTLASSLMEADKRWIRSLIDDQYDNLRDKVSGSLESQEEVLADLQSKVNILQSEIATARAAAAYALSEASLALARNGQLEFQISVLEVRISALEEQASPPTPEQEYPTDPLAGKKRF